MLWTMVSRAEYVCGLVDSFSKPYVMSLIWRVLDILFAKICANIVSPGPDTAVWDRHSWDTVHDAASYRKNLLLKRISSRENNFLGVG